MILPNFNNSIIDLGFISIKWYSLAYIFGILAAWFMLKYYDKKYKLSIYNDGEKKLFCDDFFFYSVLGIVIGGRFGYVFFYDFTYFLNNPLDIFAIWNGGMSFHGGLIGAILACMLLCRKYDINPLLFFDVIVTAVPIGLFLGRITNFINLELYGRPTNLPWGMIFPNSDGIPRHPSQLYEALLEGLILFLILNFLAFKKKFSVIGLNSSIFLICYSIFRIFVECFREPDIQLGFFFKYITMGQILSIPVLILGIYIFVKKVYGKF